jgi:serine protease Do
VRVKSVRPDSPAARAGITAGDLLISFNHAAISTSDDLIDLVSSTEPGTEVSIEIFRAGERIVLDVEVGRQPPGFRPRPGVPRE